MLVWVTFRLCQDVLSPKGKGHMLREELSLVFPYWSPARWEGALLNNENPPQALQAQLPPPSGVRLQCLQSERLLDVSQTLQTAELREVALPRAWNWAEHPCQNWALLKPQPALRPTTLGKLQALGETVNSLRCSPCYEEQVRCGFRMRRNLAKDNITMSGTLHFYDSNRKKTSSPRHFKVMFANRQFFSYFPLWKTKKWAWGRQWNETLTKRKGRF